MVMLERTQSQLETNASEILRQAQGLRVSDGEEMSILGELSPDQHYLVLVLPHLGDFDSLEYAGWLQRESLPPSLQVRAVGIGDRAAGERFCQYTGFPRSQLWMDSQALLHQQLCLYPGLSLALPGFSARQNAWLNLLLMCAGIGSPGTLAEVWRGYRGDRQAPQLLAEDETVQVGPLPPIPGKLFNYAGGSGFQRPFELATLRLRNLAESLGHWQTYVPNAAYLTQRGGTFLLNGAGELLYEHRDRGILGFAENPAAPLAFLRSVMPT